MRFANTSFFFNTLSILLIVFLYLDPTAKVDQFSCLENTINKACEMLSNLNETDYIDLGNGRKIPACMSNGVMAEQAYKLDQEYTQQILKTLEQLDGGSLSLQMSETFRDYLFRHWSNFRSDIANDLTDETSLPWPPNKKMLK